MHLKERSVAECQSVSMASLEGECINYFTWTATYAMERPVTDVSPIFEATFFLVLGLVRRFLDWVGSSDSLSSRVDDGEVNTHLKACKRS